jgi:hypothetical protein
MRKYYEIVESKTRTQARLKIMTLAGEGRHDDVADVPSFEHVAPGPCSAKTSIRHRGSGAE